MKVEDKLSIQNKRKKEKLGSDFRLFLQEEFLKRSGKNPRYSLRAFAKLLQVNHASLSSMLKGKRPITDKTKLKFGKILSMSPQELSQFQKPFEEDHYQQISIDSFALISDWYHDAILELVHVKNFKPDPKWIAKKINISINEVNIAVERLVRVGLLEIKENSWIDKSFNNTIITEPHYTNIAKQRLQKQILEKALKAVEEISITDRHQSSMTLAIDENDLIEATNMIREFRRKLTKFLQRAEVNPTSVYQLSFSLFPLTNKGD